MTSTFPRWRVMPALALGTLMATVDISAVNLALPTLARVFAVSITTIEWVILSYVLTITGLLLAFGRLADRLGRKRVYGAGLLVFTAASAWCAAAGSAPMLFAARAVQGLGAAMMTANSSAILVSSFPPEERGRALGAFGATVGVGLALGPPLGGFLVAALSWRWIFLLNLPLGLLAMVQLRSRVPDDRVESRARGLDLPGTLTWSAALVLLMLGLSKGPDHDWAPAVVGPFLGGAALLLGAFVWIERRAAAPLLPPGAMRGGLGRTVTLTLLAQMLSIGLGIHLPLFLENLWGLDAGHAGRWIAVLPLTALVMAPLAGRWSDRWGPRRVSGLGMALATISLVLLTGLPAQPGAAALFLDLALFGLGLGLFSVPNASALLSSAPPESLGLASGLQATMRNLGIAGGAALMTATLASRYSAHGGGRLGHETVAPRAFALASHDAYLVFAGLAALALGLVVASPRPRMASS